MSSSSAPTLEVLLVDERPADVQLARTLLEQPSGVARVRVVGTLAEAGSWRATLSSV